ncbi:MAG: hypothetical protein P8188_05495 [Gemmatimonadota bacterium]
MSDMKSNVRVRPWTGVSLALLLAGTMGIGGCDFLDPTNVENPQTTLDDLAEAGEPTAAILSGMRAQFARMVNTASVVQEVVSDNYSIHGTGLSGTWDFPREITPGDANSTGDATGVYWNAQELKAQGNFVLDVVAPDDSTATVDQVAETHYYRGMAYLYLAENFAYAPIEEDGAALPADQLLDLAVADFDAALAGDLFDVHAQAALARAYRWLGDAGSAGAAAQAALAEDPEFAILQEYDAVSITNSANAFLVLRALQEMQPLPRLDFLDPKFLTRESGIPVHKAEEMHLILAEIELAAGNLGPAQGHMVDAIAVAEGRPGIAFVDDDPRLNADLSIRPRSANFLVRADANSPYVPGLVLDRPGPTTQATISGTSLTEADILALNTLDEGWRTFHLLRQELLFLEGRRMSDLGIRLPVMQVELDQNPTVSPDDPAAQVVVPAYIPHLNQMDLYTPLALYEETGEGGVVQLETEVTMTVDMNRILADNRVTPFGS